MRLSLEFSEVKFCANSTVRWLEQYSSIRSRSPVCMRMRFDHLKIYTHVKYLVVHALSEYGGLWNWKHRKKKKKKSKKKEEEKSMKSVKSLRYVEVGHPTES